MIRAPGTVRNPAISPKKARNRGARNLFISVEVVIVTGSSNVFLQPDHVYKGTTSRHENSFPILLLDPFAEHDMLV